VKLTLKSTKEKFDCPRGIGLALLLLPDSPVEEFKPPVLPIDREVRWKFCRGTLNEDEFYIKVSCPICHHNQSIFGHADGYVPNFRHCGGEDECPKDISDDFFKYLARRKPNKPRERETPPTNKYAVGLL
jgi:ribosomal protein S27E